MFPSHDLVGGPIKITSFYRSTDLCLALGSKPSSQHAKGQAMDIDDIYGHKTNAEMFNYIKENLDFVQGIVTGKLGFDPNAIHKSVLR